MITSFMRVVYPLKYASNACLSSLDNGPLFLEFYLFKMTKCHTGRCPIQLEGVLPKQNTQLYTSQLSKHC